MKNKKFHVFKQTDYIKSAGAREGEQLEYVLAIESEDGYLRNVGGLPSGYLIAEIRTDFTKFISRAAYTIAGYAKEEGQFTQVFNGPPEGVGSTVVTQTNPTSRIALADHEKETLDRAISTTLSHMGQYTQPNGQKLEFKR